MKKTWNLLKKAFINDLKFSIKSAVWSKIKILKETVTVLMIKQVFQIKISSIIISNTSFALDFQVLMFTCSTNKRYHKNT